MPSPAQPPPKPAPAQREAKAWTDFDRLARPRREDRVVIGSAMLLTILLHSALFFWVLPWIGKIMEREIKISALANRPPPPPVELNLAPMTPEDLAAMRYMESNPKAPTVKPEATNNISDRDQRAAQIVPTPDGQSDKPKTEGQNKDSAKIVSGGLQQPTAQASPAQPEQKPAAQPAPTAPPPSATAPAALPARPTTPEGEGIRLEEKPIETPADKLADNTLSPTANPTLKNTLLKPGPLTPETVAAMADAATPAQRASVYTPTHAGPLVIETQGTHNAGLAPSVDAKFSQYGQYLAQMYAAIGAAWDISAENYTFSLQDTGTKVETLFVLNSQGQVEEVAVLNSTASRGATLLCTGAIKSPAPYGAWSKEMVALLGERQTIRITFYYQ